MLPSSSQECSHTSGPFSALAHVLHGDHGASGVQLSLRVLTDGVGFSCRKDVGQSQPGWHDGVLLRALVLCGSQEPENWAAAPYFSPAPTAALLPPQDSAAHSTMGTRPQMLPSTEQKFSSGENAANCEKTHICLMSRLVRGTSLLFFFFLYKYFYNLLSKINSLFLSQTPNLFLIL